MKTKTIIVNYDTTDTSDVKLMNYRDRIVLASVSKNAYILNHLACSKGHVIKYIVATRRCLPVETLTMLANDKNMFVALKVLENSSITNEIEDIVLSRDDWRVIHCHIVNSPFPTASVLNKIFKLSTSPDVLARLAQHYRVPTETLFRLALSRFSM